MKKKVNESTTIALFAVWLAIATLLVALGAVIHSTAITAIGGGMVGAVIFCSVFVLIWRCPNE